MAAILKHVQQQSAGVRDYEGIQGPGASADSQSLMGVTKI